MSVRMSATVRVKDGECESDGEGCVSVSVNVSGEGVRGEGEGGVRMRGDGEDLFALTWSIILVASLIWSTLTAWGQIGGAMAGFCPSAGPEQAMRKSVMATERRL